MTKRVVSMLLVLCLVLAMATGCSSGQASDPADAAAISETRVFVDSAKREVEVPTEVTRIVPAGTLAQIALFALAPEMFVGLSTKWSPDDEQYIAKDYYNLPVLGQFYGKGELNLEEVAKSDPQMIIDIGEPKKTVVEDMDSIQEQIGVPTIHIEAKLETMADAYRMLGDLLGKEKEAEVLATYCEEVNTKTEELMAKVADDKKVKLVYALGENGLNVLAKGSFHGEVIDRMSDNVAVLGDIASSGMGNPIDMEQLALWDPDTIIFGPDSIYQDVASDPAWQELKAIKNKAYFEVPSGPYNWMGSPPSVNRLMGMIWLGQLLYPAEANYDVFEEATHFYELFYHHDLTKDQYDTLVGNSLGK